MAIFDNEYVISLSEPMNCREHLFNVSLEADAEPGDYRIQVSLIHNKYITVSRLNKMFLLSSQ